LVFTHNRAPPKVLAKQSVDRNAKAQPEDETTPILRKEELPVAELLCNHDIQNSRKIHRM